LSGLREDGLRYVRCEKPGQALFPCQSAVDAKLGGAGVDNIVGHPPEPSSVSMLGQDERSQGV